MLLRIILLLGCLTLGVIGAEDFYKVRLLLESIAREGENRIGSYC